MSNIIVFGATGLLGSRLCPFLEKNGFNIIRQSREADAELQIEPTDYIAIITAIKKFKPKTIINLIASTNVDQCEKDPINAWLTNVNVTEAISQAIIKSGKDEDLIHLIHISTDQVYSGKGPHKEEDVKPINIYGLTKLSAELFVENIGGTILRTNFYGRINHSKRLSYSEWIINSLLTEKNITLFDDIRFSALHIDTLCNMILKCILVKPKGVYNLGCRNGLSKADFGIKLAQVMKLPINNVAYGKIIDAKLTAIRPNDMSLNINKIEKELNLICPEISEEILKTAMEYK